MGGSGDPGAFFVFLAPNPPLASPTAHHWRYHCSARTSPRVTHALSSLSLSPLVRTGSGVEDKRKSERRDNCCGALLGVGGGGVASLPSFSLQFLPLEVNEQTKNAVKVQRVGCYSLLLEYSLTAVSRR